MSYPAFDNQRAMLGAINRRLKSCLRLAGSASMSPLVIQTRTTSSTTSENRLYPRGALHHSPICRRLSWAVFVAPTRAANRALVLGASSLPFRYRRRPSQALLVVLGRALI